MDMFEKDFSSFEEDTCYLFDLQDLFDLQEIFFEIIEQDRSKIITLIDLMNALVLIKHKEKLSDNFNTDDIIEK